jgi:hypothetical protein
MGKKTSHEGKGGGKMGKNSSGSDRYKKIPPPWVKGDLRGLLFLK